MRIYGPNSAADSLSFALSLSFDLPGRHADGLAPGRHAAVTPPSRRRPRATPPSRRRHAAVTPTASRHADGLTPPS
ncbi:MAG: hypothetical protein KGQ66_14635, partial [Acidobacteriota bacterium]|nr:hypothetical protein [Acidobacteriota bacterium]